MISNSFKIAEKDRVTVRNDASSIVSIALFFMWWQLLLFVFPSRPATIELFSVTFTWGNMPWVTFMIGMLFSSLGLWAANQKINLAAIQRMIHIGSGIVAAFASILVLFATGDATLQQAGGFVAGMGATGCMQGLFAFLAKRNRHKRVFLMCLASLAACILTMIFFLIPMTATWAFLGVLPALSAVLLSSDSSGIRKTSKQPKLAGSIGAKDPHTSSAEVTSEKVTSLNRSSGIVICILVVFLTYFHTSITGAIADDFSVEQALLANIIQCSASALIAALILGIVLLFLKESAVSYACFLIIALALVLPGFIPGYESILLSNAIIASNRILMMLLIVNALASLAQRENAPFTLSQGACICVAIIPACALSSQLIGILIFVNIGLGAHSISTVAIAVLFVVFIIQGAVFYRKDKIEVVLKGGFKSEHELNLYRSRALQLEYEDLSDREAEVITLMLAGMNSKSIAQKLTISDNTAKSHIQHIYGKLNIHSRQELLLLADRVAHLEDDKEKAH